MHFYNYFLRGAQATSTFVLNSRKQLRQIQADGSIVYFNGDRTTTPAPKTKCNCGFKHYWDGREYDNNPTM